MQRDVEDEIHFSFDSIPYDAYKLRLVINGNSKQLYFVRN